MALFLASCDSMENNLCDCDKKITDESCTDYDVRCPPTVVEPDGYIHTSVHDAKNCSDMILQSECDPVTGLCVCPAGLVRYGGGFCQIDINGMFCTATAVIHTLQ